MWNPTDSEFSELQREYDNQCEPDYDDDYDDESEETSVVVSKSFVPKLTDEEYEVIRLRELENKARIEASPEYREMKIRQQEQVWVDWDFEYKYGFSPNQDCDYD
jgi:hypothetical protein